jgi:hypothetical protein
LSAGSYEPQKECCEVDRLISGHDGTLEAKNVSQQTDIRRNDDRRVPSSKGLIFGINTTTDDKVRIIEIIKQKCIALRRADFRFCEAFYDSRKRDIGHIE